MVKSTHFLQNCPTCGRQLEIRIAYIGRKVACAHCRGEFVAEEALVTDESPSAGSSTILQRAQELIDRASAAKSPAAQT